MGIKFDTQGIECKFGADEKHEANWISAGTKVKAWSNRTKSYQQFAIHLNIIFSGIFHDDSRNVIIIRVCETFSVNS